MEIKSKPTVMIGIPVFNESANISTVLKSLIDQRSESYFLEKILVICDGSEDDTPQKVADLAKRFRKISYIDSHERKGYGSRVKELINMNKSDIFILFDGDVAIKNKFFLDSLLLPFQNKNIVLTTPKLMPVKPDTRFGKIYFKWKMLWMKIFDTWKDGNNIYQIHGSGTAVRKEFLDKVSFPKELVYIMSKYLYLKAKKENYGYRYCKDAIIYSNLPSGIKEYALQSNRLENTSVLKKEFGEMLNLEYMVPVDIKKKVIFRELFTRPIDLFYCLLFFLIENLIVNNYKTEKKYIWTPSYSTKKEIQVT